MSIEEEVKKATINQLCEIYGWSPKEAEDAYNKNKVKASIWAYIIIGIIICSFCIFVYGIILATY